MKKESPEHLLTGQHHLQYTRGSEVRNVVAEEELITEWIYRKPFGQTIEEYRSSRIKAKKKTLAKIMILSHIKGFSKEHFFVIHLSQKSFELLRESLVIVLDISITQFQLHSTQ